MTNQSPIYDSLVAERLADGEWTPADLRPPYDLDDAVGRSYERVMVRNHLLRLVDKRKKIKGKKRPRTTPLP